MTTLEEISRCPKANRQFWSDRARLNLACMRDPGADKSAVRLERSAFRANMRNRRSATFLNDNA